jgi:hypothetical protein
MRTGITIKITRRRHTILVEASGLSAASTY